MTVFFPFKSQMMTTKTSAVGIGMCMTYAVICMTLVWGSWGMYIPESLWAKPWMMPDIESTWGTFQAMVMLVSGNMPILGSFCLSDIRIVPLKK